MPVITVHGPDGTHTIEGRSGETLLSALQRAGLREPEAPCGGNGTCGKCMAAVSGAVTPADAQERALLPAGAIGLLPPELVARTRCVGNSASAGAAATLLSRQARDELTAIRDKCRYLERSTEAAFTRHYVDCMLFEP